MSSPAAGTPHPLSPDVRTLVLLRHGKSAYPPGVSDHDRPLAPRGRREAALAGKWIQQHVPPLDYILCSSAARTRQTLEATGLATPTVLVDVSSSIYEAYPEELLELVTAAPPADRTVLLVGHAPGVPGARRNAGRTRIEHRRPARMEHEVSDVRARGSRCRG